MEDFSVEGYHATQKNYADNILADTYIPSPSGQDHWLGGGVYFWANLYYAVQWNIINSSKRNHSLAKQLKKRAILVSKIKCNSIEVIDLSSPQGLRLYQNFIQQVIAETSDPQKKEELKNINDDRFWVNMLDSKDFFVDYSLVIATYHKSPKDNTLPTEDSEWNFIKAEQKQLCVKKLNIIQDTQLYNNIETIRALYKLMY